MISDAISVYAWETLIASALAVVIAVALALLIVRMVRHAEVDVTSDFLFSGTPDDASTTALRALDGLKGAELRPVSPYDFHLVRRVVPKWAMVFLVFGPLPGIILSLVCRQEQVTRAFLTPGPGSRPMLRLTGRLTKPQSEELQRRLASVAVRL
jgi:hypothetical protein